MPRALLRLTLALALSACATTATTLPLGTGSARVRADGSTMELEVTGPAGGLTTVYVAAGQRVLVLHASAALGTGIYERDGGTWRRVQGFTWQCRDGAETDCRARFFAAQKWWAEVHATGSSRRRLVIDRSLLGADGKVVIVGYVYPGQIAAWPAAPGDDTVREDLLRGELPDEATFTPERWGRL